MVGEKRLRERVGVSEVGGDEGRECGVRRDTREESRFGQCLNRRGRSILFS